MSASVTKLGISRCKWRSAAARRIRALAGRCGSTEDAVAIVVRRLLNAVRYPPTDLEAIATKLGAEIQFDESILGSGALEQTAMGYRILCSPHQPPTRQRFTIAHEIAHVVFETTGPRCPRRGFELEMLCDMLSGGILIPIDVIRVEVGTKPSLLKLKRLSEVCQASLTATIMRATEAFAGVSGGEFNRESGLEKPFGVHLRWLAQQFPHRLSELLDTTQDAPHGRVCQRLPTQSGMAMFVIEWESTGRNDERTLVLTTPLV